MFGQGLAPRGGRNARYFKKEQNEAVVEDISDEEVEEPEWRKNSKKAKDLRALDEEIEKGGDTADTRLLAKMFKRKKVSIFTDKKKFVEEVKKPESFFCVAEISIRVKICCFFFRRKFQQWLTMRQNLQTWNWLAQNLQTRNWKMQQPKMNKKHKRVGKK
jgi:hypothetical protein